MTGILPHSVVEDVVAEAQRRLAALTRTASRYENLRQMAAISQDLGNDLSQQIYAASTQPLACKYGCATCCQIPAAAPQVTTTDFTMTLIDVVALLEHLGDLKFEAVASTDAGPEALLSVRCPQLTSAGTCGIYDHRPVTCKIWFSANLSLCIRNRERGYQAGVNPVTDESDRLRTAFEAPFGACLAEIAPGLPFRGHDFLSIFSMMENLARQDLTAAFRAHIDAGLPVAAAYDKARLR